MIIPRRVLFGKLNLTLFRAAESATAFAKLRGNPYVELTHWFHQLWQLDDGDIHRICQHYRIEREAVHGDLIASLSRQPIGASSLQDFSPHVIAAIERAWSVASLEFGAGSIRGAWLLVALLRSAELRRLLLGMSSAFGRIPVDALADALPSIVAGSPEDGEGPHDGSGLFSAAPGEASHAFAVPRDGRSALDSYCADLTAQALAGKIDPVVGRDQEIRSIVDILLRRRQNNPLLTGDAGVGKTAVVEGLACAIVSGDVPPALRLVRLLSLDIGALIAGASMRGEFEARLKRVLEEALASTQPIVLFIDEVHTLVGAGGQAGTGDAANLLKPALARGSLRTIGATTWSEYKRHIEKDPALTRRFQVLQVLEPDERAATAMVRGLVPAFARHHGVAVLDEAVRAAVLLSHRYIPARQLPDKAISLLDTACARVAMSLHTPPAAVAFLRQQILALESEVDLLGAEASIAKGSAPRRERIVRIAEQLEVDRRSLGDHEARWRDELAVVEQILVLRREVDEASVDAAVTAQGARSDALASLEQRLADLQQDAPWVLPQVDESTVASIVADWTGIPVGRMLRDEVEAVFALRSVLRCRVMGQNQALDVIAERIQTARAGLTDPGKPVGVFLLVGPSGVGKTETAVALAEAMYGGEQNLITLNMSEFQEPHTVSTLKGSPPGYVGYGEGGVLTEAVRRKPYSVVLLDEIEKAHRDVHELFYQVFDKGWMEDGEGRRIDFRNTTILLTSNTGAELIAQLCDDRAFLPDASSLRELLQPALRAVFPAAFLGRLAVVPYLPLPVDALDGIVALHLRRVADRMREQHGVALSYASSVGRYVIAQCGTHESGARRLIGFIEQHLLPVLSRHWLDALQAQRKVSHMFVDVLPADPGRPHAEGGRIACDIEYI